MIKCVLIGGMGGGLLGIFKNIARAVSVKERRVVVGKGGEDRCLQVKGQELTNPCRGGGG